MHERRNLAIIIALTFLAVMLLSVFLTACSCEQGDREAGEIVEEEETYNSFVVLSSEYLDYGVWQVIMYDPQTRIMWTYVEGSDGGGLSIIYNVDGSPMLYEK